MLIFALFTLVALSLNSFVSAGPIEPISDQDLRRARRSCRWGWNSDMCRISEVNGILKAHKWLSSGESPGKRSQDSGVNPEYDVISSQVSSVAIPEEASAAQFSNVENERRDDILLLKKILKGLTQNRESQTTDVGRAKRTCRLRLGGHCTTEALDRAATSYYYLKSGDSPGKRRRRDVSAVRGGQMFPSSTSHESGHFLRKQRRQAKRVSLGQRLPLDTRPQHL